MGGLLRVLDLVPRVVAVISGVAGVLLGVGASILVFTDGHPAKWLRAVGVLLLLAPTASIVLASANYTAASTVLSPVRWLVKRYAR